MPFCFSFHSNPAAGDCCGIFLCFGSTEPTLLANKALTKRFVSSHAGLALITVRQFLRLPNFSGYSNFAEDPSRNVPKSNERVVQRPFTWSFALGVRWRPLSDCRVCLGTSKWSLK